MRTLVIGDVHGCADELAALLDKVSPDRVVLVGDLFAKGPDPARVYRMIRDGGMKATLGNHDQRLLDTADGLRIDAPARRCVDALDAAEPTWKKWLRKRPLFLPAGPFTVVHAGMHPSGKRSKTTREMAISMRRWPFPEEPARAPKWYDVYYGKHGVIFGHDARVGLVRREHEGEPWLIGLDTGCVYGGKLSGYWVERDKIVQVKARRRYKSFG